MASSPRKRRVEAEVVRVAEESGEHELKTVEPWTDFHETQLLSYLRFFAKRGGFLLNFWCWPLKDGGIKRILNSRVPLLSSPPPRISA
jgi:hypothetical protein